METTSLIRASCPECRGPVSEIKLNGIKEFRCLVGHAYSARSLLQTHSRTQEEALWAAVVALEEVAYLVDAIADQLPEDLVRRLREQAELKHRQAQEVRSVIERLEPFSTE